MNERNLVRLFKGRKFYNIKCIRATTEVLEPALEVLLTTVLEEAEEIAEDFIEGEAEATAINFLRTLLPTTILVQPHFLITLTTTREEEEGEVVAQAGTPPTQHRMHYPQVSSQSSLDV